MRQDGEHAAGPARIERERKNLPVIKSLIGILEMFSVVVARQNAKFLGADQHASRIARPSPRRY